MAITEILWNSWKNDQESIAAVKGYNQLTIDTFNTFVGLESAHLGTILEENGAPPKNPDAKNVYALQWPDEQTLWNVFHTSQEFQIFIKKVGPLMASKSTPELFSPVEGEALAALEAPLTQILQFSTGTEAEQASSEIVDLLKARTKIYRATGTGKDEHAALVLIGWDSIEDYRSISESADVKAQLHKLPGLQNALVEFKSTGKQ